MEAAIAIGAEYVDEVPLGEVSGLQADDVLTYYVVSINNNGSSAPSNEVSITLVAVSSAPLNFNAVALREAVNLASIKSLFQNPEDVAGATENAYFVVNVYNDEGRTTIVETQNIEYVENQEEAYQANFNNIAFYEIYYLAVYLVTHDPNSLEDELIGATAVTETSCGYAPLIYKINGSTDLSLWTQINEITSLEVITFSSLVLNGAYITMIDGDGSGAHNYALNAIATEVITTIANTPYVPFAGAFLYTYTNIPTNLRFAVAVFCANVHGMSSASVNGPFSIPFSNP